MESTEQKIIRTVYAEDDSPVMVMWRTAEAIKLIAKYANDFSDDTDRDDLSSLGTIISEYLFDHADKLAKTKEYAL